VIADAAGGHVQERVFTGGAIQRPRLLHGEALAGGIRL
jgi:hypothetical protein